MSKNCPICNTQIIIKFAPFCSNRCANVDLSKWLNGAYSIPTDEIGVDSVNEFENIDDD
ncbi:MAG: DNA gyrase inhibitor YacG [Hellea sp.]|nr:DNA gyrase inhibitor YacG [Hellea sp.]MDG1522438.1 DNA gyrase inhibitor YacG [Hellea sp.]MDG1667179.1 DNA gyrase inhibitor YacG [Hellea sp.]MDG2361187.1 DNA gyrase inhibitor YacG [Hellea sp.]